MNGQFYTDITRDTFRLHRHFSRVLMQQGRVQLDSDWNEQVDILLHYLRTFVAGVIGPHGGFDDGFKVEKYTRIGQVQSTGRGRRAAQKAAESAQPEEVPYHFLINSGHYYVNGLLCENDRSEYVFSIPPALRPAQAQSATAQKADAGKDEAQVTYCIYLDVWEREVTYLEDALIREVALGGPDTTTRSEVVAKICAVKTEDAGTNAPDPGTSKYHNANGEFQQELFAADWTTQLQSWQGTDHGKLQAKTGDVEQASKEPCAIPPTSQYRSLENQLYRVEIHDGGDPASATFKWSRENGTVMFPIIGQISSGPNQTSLTVTLGNLGRDDSRFGLKDDDWVELVSVADEMEGEPGPLMRVQSVEPASRQVTLASQDNKGVTIPDQTLFLRRWDYGRGDPGAKSAPQIADSGALQIVDGWLALEHGVQIQFIADATTTYRIGDYWLIPARTATGNIEWPRHNDHPDSLPPHGVKHYYAPLCYVKLTGGKIAQDSDLIHLRKVIARQ